MYQLVGVFTVYTTMLLSMAAAIQLERHRVLIRAMIKTLVPFSVSLDRQQSMISELINWSCSPQTNFSDVQIKVYRIKYGES
jgi:hypothetical protein